MKNLKFHFQFHKNDRNGILFLLLLIIIVQLIYVFVKFTPYKSYYNEEETAKLQKILDSVHPSNAVVKNKIKLFNPNYISDYTGAQLGMSVEELDRLFAFRKRNKYVNSSKEFQAVTQVSDSLLKVISPYFKFPNSTTENNKWVAGVTKGTSLNGVKDINTATAKELQSVKGIGKVYANRIVNYRSKLGGYSADDQLAEVWGLKRKTLEALLQKFRVLEKPVVKQLDINKASLDNLVTSPYLNYETAKEIIAYREKVSGIKTFEELSALDGVTEKMIIRFPIYFYIKK